MAYRHRVVWERGRRYRGKKGGIREVIAIEADGRLLCRVVDSGGHMAVEPGNLIRVSNLAMKRWTHNDDKTVAMTGGE